MDMDILESGQHHAPAKIDYRRIRADMRGGTSVGSDVANAAICDRNGLRPRPVRIHRVDPAVPIDRIGARCGVRRFGLAARSCEGNDDERFD